MVLTLTVTPTFMTQLLALPTRDSKNINAKVLNLCHDPTPDGKQRKRLRHNRHNLFRTRYGKYRVLYDFNASIVRALCVDTRDSIYDDLDDFVPEDLGTVEPLPEIDVATIDLPVIPEPRSWDRVGPAAVATAVEDLPVPESAAVPDDLLERPIDAHLLAAIRVPAEYHARLDGIRTFSELVEADIPQDLANRLFAVTTEPDIDRIIEGPTLEVTDPDDLDRLVDGDIVELLLRLDPDQVRLVSLAVNAGGPVMVKGGPGSGKTTIAVRRVERIIAALRADGASRCRNYPPASARATR